MPNCRHGRRTKAWRDAANRAFVTEQLRVVLCPFQTAHGIGEELFRAEILISAEFRVCGAAAGNERAIGHGLGRQTMLRSLILGILVRIGGVFGALLILTYWLAHMNFPYVETQLNFLIDFHVVYAGALVYLLCKGAGHIYGLDAWLAPPLTPMDCPVM